MKHIVCFALDSSPSSPSATVTRAHVHPTPPASHLPVPESGAAAAAPPDAASAPPEPAAQASPSLETPVQPEAQSSPEPEPVPEPPQATQIEVVPPPTTPPPSPVTPHTPASTPPREVKAHQEPEENSESDIQDTSNDDGVIPDQLSAREGEVVVDSEVTPPPCELDTPLQTTATAEAASSPPEEVNANQEPEENSESDIQDTSGDNVVIPDQVSEVLVNSVGTPPPLSPCETDTDPDPLRTTGASEVSPPQSPTQANSDVTDGSSFPILTPEKHPVQDTTPPEDIKAAEVLEPGETESEPPITQVNITLRFSIYIIMMNKDELCFIKLLL